MGSSSSKFKKYLQHGDEFAAMQVFQSSPELRKNLDPNLSYGEHHSHNTALHYAAKHGMKHLLRTFLIDLGGNPNKKNGLNETVLHTACQLDEQKNSFSAQERRATCVTLLLQWKGVPLNSGGREKVDINAQDHDGNTALHWAAATGLKRCVELLVSQQNAALFIENNEKMTPCDLAMKSNHHDIARLLEARMVFADNSDTVNEDEFGYEQADQEVYSGLRTQDLQEAKDQLLVETSDMLHIPLFTAEALLRDNEWSRELLLEKWMKDPVQCCSLAGVQAPASALQQAGTVELTLNSPQSSFEKNDNERSIEIRPDIVCEICLTNLPIWDQHITMSCKHNFCSYCWERYLNLKIEEGDAHHILCPAYQCHILVPVELIEKLVSPDMAKRYLQFDIKAFVESNKSIKWCPMAGCGRAVRLPETEQSQPNNFLPNNINDLNFKPPPATSHAVDCGNSHFFCWECLGEAHAPCGCIQWQQWQQKIAEIKPEELRANCDESEAAANCLWLVTNSKPCPNCKSPIQKNEGCNHMKCSKCKFDFCWVCQESWKRHSSATGGYFRCNRFEAVNKADEKQGNLITAAVVRNSQLEELTRFLHYYTRFRNHENSQKLEEPLLTGVQQKMEILANALKGSEEFSEKDMKFVEDGVRELLKARRVLCGSYVYGYYLEDNGYNKTIFEFMQNELEEVTEKLSEIIARPYLRTPKAVIMQTTALARRKRHEFVRAVSKGLIPPETPPSLRKPEMHRALEASLKQLDANNAWLKEAHERHQNSLDPYDWPDYDSDEETGVNQALAVSILGECKRRGCKKPRARNPRNGVIHQYCSLRCCKYETTEIYRVPISTDYNMDLVIALEMSRLQMIEDRMRKVSEDSLDRSIVDVLENLNDSTNRPGTSEAFVRNSKNETALDEQLKLAIQLSLQETVANSSKPHTESVSTSTQAPEPNTTLDHRDSIRRHHQKNETTSSSTKSIKHSPKKDSSDICKVCKNSVENCSRSDNNSSTTKYNNEINTHNLACHTDKINNDNTNTKNRYTAAHYEKLNADLTVDYFLKSLTQHTLENNFKIETINEFDPEYSKNNDKELPCFFKTIPVRSRNEDGRFQISDIHESGYIELVKNDDDHNSDIFDERFDVRLKRSHSTGDLIIRKSRRDRRIRLGLGGTVVHNEDSKYHLDSDHSSNHDEKCEEIARKILNLPSSAIVGAKQFLLLQHQTGGISGPSLTSESTSSFNDNSSTLFYQGQSSLEENTTSESLNAEDQQPIENVNKKQQIQRQNSFDQEMSTPDDHEDNTPRPVEPLKPLDTNTFQLRNYKKSPKLLRSSHYVEQQTSASSPKKSKKHDHHSLFGKKSHSKSEKEIPTADMVGSSFIIQTEIPDIVPTSKMNPLACLKAKLCSAHLPKTNYLSKLAVNKFSDNDLFKQRQPHGSPSQPSSSSSSSSRNKSEKSFKIGSGKTISQNLRIKICKSPGKSSHNNTTQTATTTNTQQPEMIEHKQQKVLETDSSNEYESETGIPKSPTLYISGVSISRTPEPKNANNNTNNNVGKQSRSSSLTVPTVINITSQTIDTTSNQSLNLPGSPELYTPSLALSRTPQTSYTNIPRASPSPSKTVNLLGKENYHPMNLCSRSTEATPCKSNDNTVIVAAVQQRVRSNSSVLPKDLSSVVISPGMKSKSANEPEREREMFRFPKSSTDGALSSVLHVQESNLSSDDFHEALFLLERSPKTRDSKRRKRSKKKEKDIINKEEASSAL